MIAPPVVCVMYVYYCRTYETACVLTASPLADAFIRDGHIQWIKVLRLVSAHLVHDPADHDGHLLLLPRFSVCALGMAVQQSGRMFVHLARVVCTESRVQIILQHLHVQRVAYVCLTEYRSGGVQLFLICTGAAR